MKLLEIAQIVVGFVPVDMQAGANAGDWVNMKHFDHCVVMLTKAAGTAGDDPVLKLEQATDVTGAGVKDLDVIDRIFVKQGVQTTISNFTEVTQAADEDYTELTSAENQALWVVEIDAEQLDADGGFTCLRASVADVGGNAQLGVLHYILMRARYQGKVANMPSAIL